MKGYQISVSRTRSWLLPVLLGVVLISGLGAFISLLGYRLACHPASPLLQHLHPLLQTFSLLFLGLATLLHRLPCLKRKLSKVLHVFLAITSISLGILGLWAMWTHRDEGQKERTYEERKEIKVEERIIEKRSVGSPALHLHSLHSWLGIISLTFVGIQLTMGLLLFLCPCLGRARSSYLPLHTFTGLGLVISTTAAALMGLSQESIASSPNYGTQLTVEGVLLNSTGLLLCIFCTTVCYVATKSSFKQFD